MEQHIAVLHGKHIQIVKSEKQTLFTDMGVLYNSIRNFNVPL